MFILFRCMNCNLVSAYPEHKQDGNICSHCNGQLQPIARGTKEEILHDFSNKDIVFHDSLRKDGLTDQEGKVMDALINAWDAFMKLDRQHPSEVNDFADGIHRCQDLLAVRIARREYPEGWPIKKGCPAKNDSCKYLFQGICICRNPKIGSLNDKIACSSFE